jgi:hypothetical protein
VGNVPHNLINRTDLELQFAQAVIAETRRSEHYKPASLDRLQKLARDLPGRETEQAHNDVWSKKCAALAMNLPHAAINLDARYHEGIGYRVWEFDWGTGLLSEDDATSITSKIKAIARSSIPTTTTVTASGTFQNTMIPATNRPSPAFSMRRVSETEVIVSTNVSGLVRDFISYQHGDSRPYLCLLYNTSECRCNEKGALTVHLENPRKCELYKKHEDVHHRGANFGRHFRLVHGIKAIHLV